MLVKRIDYTDYDGNERSEDFYFNLSKAELIEWMVTNDGYTFDKVVDEMARKSRAKDVVHLLSDIILRSYGEKSIDGRSFIKSKEVTDNFRYTEAYSNLLMEFLSDSAKSAEFLNGIVPRDLAAAVEKIMSENPDATPEELRALAENGTTKVSAISEA